MADIVRDFLSFLSVVVTNFAAYLTGGIVVAAWLIYERFKDKPVPFRAFVAGLIAFLLVAFFAAWRTERKRVVRSEERIRQLESDLAGEKKKRLPDLRGDILMFAIGKPEKRPDVTSVTVFAQIRNLGMPSIAEEYILSLDVPGRGHVARYPTHLIGAKEIKLFPENVPQGFSFGGHDWLYDKTAEPIPSGGKVEGVMIFLFDGVRWEEIMSAKQTVTLTFQDVEGTKLIMTRPPENQQPGASYFPGMRSVEPLPKERSRR